MHASVCICVCVCVCVCVLCGVMLQSSDISLDKAVGVQFFIPQAKCSDANTVNYLSSLSFKILC